MREYDLFIDGKFVPAARSATTTSTNLLTGRPVAVLARASGRDARRAVDAARRAADAGVWRDLPPRERAGRLLGVIDMLYERQAEIADLDVAEAGVPIRIAYDFVAGAIARQRAAVDAITSARMLTPDQRGSFVARQPLGVVAIAPGGDLPFARSLTAVCGALAAGNSVVLRPPPASCSSAMEIASAASDAGLPAGVVNVLPAAGPDVDDECATNPFVDLFAFTGRAEPARRVAERAAPSLKRLLLDVASGSTAIVRRDADLDRTVPAILWGAMLLSGQTPRHCARAVVDASIVEPFTYYVARGAAALRLGDPSDFATDLGPMRDAEEARTSIERMLGADAMRVGREEPSPGAAFVRPVVVQAGADARVAWDGSWGPVLAVIPAHSDAQAVEIANRPPARRAASVFSRDTTEAIAVARNLSASTVWINDHLPAARAGDGIALADDEDDGWELRSRVASSAPPALREDARFALLRLGRTFGFDET